MAKKLRHRGPDSMGVYKNASAGTFLCHKRLAIVGTGAAGDQPLFTRKDQSIAYVANGEIYNHASLRRGADSLCRS